MASPARLERPWSLIFQSPSAARSQEDVGRRQIAVQHQLLADRLHPGEQLADDLVGRRERRLQGAATRAIHDDVRREPGLGPQAVVIAGVTQDILVADREGAAQLIGKAERRAGICKRGRQDLEDARRLARMEKEREDRAEP